MLYCQEPLFCYLSLFCWNFLPGAVSVLLLTFKMIHSLVLNAPCFPFVNPVFLQRGHPEIAFNAFVSTSESHVSIN